MKRAFGIVLVGFTLLQVSACSSDSDGSGSTGDPVTACKSAAKATCKKVFACFSKDELALAAEIVGNNEADCATKFSAECTPDKAKCDSGQTFDSATAKECLNQINALSCNQIKSDTTAEPAACSQYCK